MSSDIKVAGIPELLTQKIDGWKSSNNIYWHLKTLVFLLPLISILDTYFKDIIPQREENYTTKILLQSFLL